MNLGCLTEKGGREKKKQQMQETTVFWEGNKHYDFRHSPAPSRVTPRPRLPALLAPGKDEVEDTIHLEALSHLQAFAHAVPSLCHI